MDLKKFIYGHCVSPVRVRVWDTYTSSYIVRELPCGKCLHCKNTHVNEWVTRLYAQAKYSAYVYYITLDYAPFDISNTESRKLAAETAACYHNLNSTKSYGMHPLLLKKNHLQDFFKRFRRKNENIKIQYFACGEYGTHANGRGYGRPHFHAIIFSNFPISHDMFQDAWTINGYKIGNVDYNDLRANGSLDNINSENKFLNAKYVFKYVCKYLQKSDFDFEKLATIDFHRTYFDSLRQTMFKSDLFSELFIQDSGQSVYTWKNYISDYSPFIVCSKRPSIGYEYLVNNIERFNKRDFRLFGLSENGLVFPAYFRRKVKETYCPFVAVGKKSCLPTTSSRIGYILSVLREIEDSRTDTSNFVNILQNAWCSSKDKNGNLILNCFHGGSLVGSIPCASLHMYETYDNIFYQFNGFGYTCWQKVKKLGYVRLQDMAITDVLRDVSPHFGNYYNEYVKPMHDIKELQENELKDTIKSVYSAHGEKAEEIFLQEVYARYQAELQDIYKNKLLQQNSKNQF